MSENNKGFLRPAGANQRGQALIFVTLSLTMLLGFAGFVTDIVCAAGVVPPA